MSIQFNRPPASQRLPFDRFVDGMVPLARLQRERDSLRKTYAAAKPYPHLVLDGFFDENVLEHVLAEFPVQETRDWLAYETVHESKRASRGIAGLPAFTQLFLLQLCSEPVLEQIRYITGYDDLVGDPLYHGGGLHETPPGGWLNVHADWTMHPVLPLVRRLNLIVYLNRDWAADWGGELELIDPQTKICSARVAPVFNRAVLFATAPENLHGFPTPLSCPEDRSRKSVSVFYWSPDPDAREQGGYITFLPGLRRTRMQWLLNSLTPPILHQIRGYLRKRR
jgi:2OG-Fe(II) oxygenase superfamily